ncbi:MAG TPA: tetratricopeptide repeat protein [Acidobacteriota bacterium]|nr:tetratricopeptide repeat protein [Acidobacteriota bacterium]HQQ45790.1 tetratricopeptide repeat protein [Acidobacteriota bacterium]
MKKNLLVLATLFILLMTIAPASQERNAAALFDAAVQEEARNLAREGRLEEAFVKFREMVRRDEKEVWTTQALLVCEESDLEARAASLEEVTSEPIILIKRVIDSRTCVRVCAGLFRSRQEAAALGQQLPSPFREAKPYPLLLVTKGNYAKGAFDLASPAAVPANAQGEVSSSAPPGPEPKQAPGHSYSAVTLPAGTDPAQDLFNQGIESFNRNDLASAESLFKRSIALAPERFEAYNNLGAVLLHQKKYAEAKDVLEKAVALQPGYPNAHSNLGGAYWFLGRRQDAIGEAQKAFRLDSHNVRYCTNLASFLYEEKRYADAQIYLNVVKIIDPANEDALEIQKKVDAALGKSQETAITVVDEGPGSSTEAGAPAKTEKKSGRKEDALEEDDADPDKKPKKKFWDRFRKHRSEDGADDTTRTDAGTREE